MNEADSRLCWQGSGPWTWFGVWIVCTFVLCLLEVQLQTQRSRADSSHPPFRRTERFSTKCSLSDGKEIDESIELSGEPGRRRSVLLVVGCLGEIMDGDYEVTLTAVAVNPSGNDSARSRLISDENQDGISNNRLAHLSIETQKATPSDTTLLNVKIPVSGSEQVVQSPVSRLLFLQTRIDQNESVPLNCQVIAEGPSVRVYRDGSRGLDLQQSQLAHEIVGLIEQSLGTTIRMLVGPIIDVDSDGKLAVVLTSHLGQQGTFLQNVDGLTRQCDFRPEIPRPAGNEADVIFLNERLESGERLQAILAHELAHAAITSRRLRNCTDHQKVLHTEEDWLNEAIAHWIEVRASGSSANLQHRIDQFSLRPESAPLIVSNYFRPDYWRHHGCRGASYSFLNWCVAQSGEGLIARLLDNHTVGIENVEQAMNSPFEDVFRKWTISVGESKLRGKQMKELNDGQAEGVQAGDSRHDPGSWDLDDRRILQRRVTLKGTTASFIHVQLPDTSETWRFSAECEPDARIQLSAISLKP